MTSIFGRRKYHVDGRLGHVLSGVVSLYLAAVDEGLVWQQSFYKTAVIEDHGIPIGRQVILQFSKTNVFLSFYMCLAGAVLPKF